MHPPKNTHKQDRARLQLTLAVWCLGLVGLIIGVSFNISNYRSSFLEAQAYQQEKALEVADRVKNFFYVAQQLADTLQVFLEKDPARDKGQIERYLDHMVESAPMDLIYGAGAWWEPRAFDGTTELFGPYVHRRSPGSVRVLTYEWSTADYYYPGQTWYRAGFVQNHHPFLTEPYFDKGIAYITLAQPFFERASGRKIGVISVDMVLPQLQTIVNKANTKPSELIAIIGRTGKVLAHPKPQELIDKARALHPEREIHSILDVASADALVGLDDRLIHSAPMPEVGWTIIVVSRPQEILAGYFKLRQVIALATVIWLLVLVLGYFLVRYFLRSLHRQRESFLYAEKMASLGEMAGGIAHEINNPLAIIQGAAQKLQIRLKNEELNREDLRSTVGIILKTAERIARIIRSLRYVVRDGSADPFVDTSIRSIIDETLALCEAKLKFENVPFEAVIPADLHCVCRGVQISQVLINLINNSMDAIRDQPNRWIRIEAEAQEPNIRIIVTDSGPGIPEELAIKIMKPFFTTKEVGKGTGLGLSISRGIVHAHNGDLELDRSSPHTRFVITLPRSHESRQTA